MPGQTTITAGDPGTSYAIIAILLTVLAQIIMQILSTFKKREEFSTVAMTQEQAKQLKEAHSKIEKLYEWHDVVDEDGFKLWYFNRILRRTVEETSETMSDIKDILKDLRETVKNNTKVIEMFISLMTQQKSDG